MIVGLAARTVSLLSTHGNLRQQRSVLNAGVKAGYGRDLLAVARPLVCLAFIDDKI
jgi:hypothetical protein